MIDRIDNNQLQEALEKLDEEDMNDLSQLKAAYPDHEADLQAIEAVADTVEQTRERLLDENDNPDHGAMFGYFDKTHRFIHMLSRNGQRTERILAYKDGYYQFGGDGLITHKMQQLMPGRVSTYHKNQVVDRAYDHRVGKKGSTSNTLYDNLADLNPPEWKLNFQNGILDLKEMEMKEHSPDLHFTTQIPYDYDPEAQPDKWLDFLNEVLPNSEEQIPKLQEWFGYLLKHWNADFEKAALLLGATNSGKGVILSTAKAVVGDDNISQMPLKAIVDSKFGNQQLLGKMVNLNNDLNHHRITNTGAAKNAISGEDVEINQKEKPKFVAEPNAKHFYSANYPPRDKIDDDAYYGRWLTFRLPESVPVEEQDRQLRQKLAEEKQGILNWAIEGLKRLEEQGQFTAERKPDEVKSLWRRYGDPIARFYHFALKYEQGSSVPKSTCHELLEEYCDALGEEAPSKMKMNEYITSQKRAIESRKRRHGGRSQRCFVNVTLKENARQELLSQAE